MKSIKILVAALAAYGLAACCNNTPKQFDGVIADATMNTVTVKTIDGAATQTFATEGADMSQAHGLLIGAPIVVEYTGCLEDVTPAVKVTLDATYTEAVGQWVMPDPINPEGVMGINIMIEGAAESINMATLVYTGWALEGQAGKITLKGQSIGNGQTIDFTETGVIAKDSTGAYTLTINEGVVYTKLAQ